jgi:predicted DNA-binding protein
MKEKKLRFQAIVSSRLSAIQKSQLNKIAFQNHCTKSEYLRKIIINNLNELS